MKYCNSSEPKLKKYRIHYSMDDEIYAKDELDAMIIHQDNLSERLGSMVKESVTEIKDVEKKSNTPLMNKIQDLLDKADQIKKGL